MTRGSKNDGQRAPIGFDTPLHPPASPGTDPRCGITAIRPNRLEKRPALLHIGPERMIGLPIIYGRVHESERANGNRSSVFAFSATVSAFLFT
jgi:hypothetical protein